MGETGGSRAARKLLIGGMPGLRVGGKGKSRVEFRIGTVKSWLGLYAGPSSRCVVRSISFP